MKIATRILLPTLLLGATVAMAPSSREGAPLGSTSFMGSSSSVRTLVRRRSRSRQRLRVMAITHRSNGRESS